MVRASPKVGSAKLVIICVGLLGFALVADFLWASSSPLASNWTSKHSTPTSVVVPNHAISKHTNNNKVLVILSLPFPFFFQMS